jgi:cell division protein FtsL
MRRSPTWLIVVAVGAATLLALTHVWMHLQLIAVGYDISRETRARHDLLEQNQRLSLELRTRMDLALVEKQARETLHMVPPDPRAIRVLRVPPAARSDGAR